jgi:flagellar basal body-associated protein FliL
MSKKKKIILIITGVILAVLGAWYIFLVTTPPLPPGNSAEGMHNFYKMQIEQQKKNNLP